MKTLQAVYDTVAEHLLTQNQKAWDGFSCMYRTSGGLKCAVGCLIKDEFYNLNLEWKALLSPTVQKALKKSGVPTYGVYLILLRSLQLVHDGFDPDKWPQKLIEIAAEYDLKPWNPA